MRSFGPRHRRLQISVSGRWFLLLTIALGVIALATGNNVIYLIESMLLSGLILSGVLSERAVAVVEVDIQRLPAISGSPSRDRVRARNRGSSTLFALEIGEWRDGDFHSLVFIPRLAGGSELSLPSRETHGKRGASRWQGLAIATSYPFGLARKIRVIHQPGERMIWPEKFVSARSLRNPSADGSGARAGSDLAEAEVRPYNHDDDSRMIVWTLSSKGSGPVVRVRKSEQPSPEVTLDLRSQQGEDFERRVRESALPFYQVGEHIAGGTLTVVQKSGERRRFHGRIRALNELAVVKPEKSESA